MATVLSPDRCETCPAKIVCRCLRVTEGHVVELIERYGLRTIRELRSHTGAGDGCTCCHADLQEYLDRHALTVVE